MAINFNNNPNPKKVNVKIKGILKHTAKVIYNGIVVWLEKVLKAITGIPPLILENSTGDDLEDYKIYGDSVQDGTPTIDTPIEIESVGDKAENLFDKNNVDNEHFIASATGKLSTDSSQLALWRCSDYIPVLPNTKYVKRGTGASTQSYYDSNKNLIDFGSVKVDTVFTTPNNCAFIKFNLAYANAPYNNVEFKEVYKKEYKIPIKVKGKNIFNFKNTTIIKSQSTAIDYEVLSENSIKLIAKRNVTSTGAYVNVRTDFDVYDLIGRTFTPSCIWESTFESTKDKAYYRFYDKEGNALGGSLPFKTFTVPENAHSLRILLYLTTGDLMNAGDSITFTDIMVEYGDTQTEFEPYIEPITTNIYLDAPLRKIRDISDYIDFEKQKVIRNIKQYVFDGTESVSEQSSNFPSDETYLFSISLSSRIDRAVAGGGWAGNYDLCNYFINANKSLQQSTNNNYEAFVGHGSVSYAGYFYFRLFKSRFTDETTKVTQFKNMIIDWYESGNPMILQYVTSSPDDTEIVELPTIPTFKRTTIIEVDTNVLPSDMEVKYYGKE